MIEQNIISIVLSIIAAFIFAISIYFYKSIIKYLTSIFMVPRFQPRNHIFQRLIHNSNHTYFNSKLTKDSFEGYFFISLTYSVFSMLKLLNKKIVKKQLRELTTSVRRIYDFYNTCICDFKVTITSPHIENSTVECSSPTCIVDKLIKPMLAINQPQLIALYGKIGCGKSTLISSIVSELYKLDNTTGKKTIEALPITIDVRRDFEKELEDIANTRSITKLEIANKLRNRLFELIKSAFEQNKLASVNHDKSIEELMRLAYRKSIRPIIILDELDIVYYQFCKVSLVPNAMIQTDLEAFREIVRFFVCFPEDDLTKGIYFSTIFIVALRQTSYEMFTNCNLVGAQISHPDHHSIRLEMTGSTQLKNILLKRLKEKHRYLSKNRHNDTKLENVSKTIESLKNDDINFQRNLELSVHGTRHLMNLFHKLDELDDSGELLLRFLTNPNSLLVIYQFLDGSLDYSQTSEGVSNIFLVNSDYSRETYDHGSSKLKDRIHEDYSKDHLQTYYLKYLVHYFIYIKGHVLSESPTLRSIVRVFAGNEGQREASLYEKEIVSLILLHSTEADHGRLIRLEMRPPGSDSLLRCTNRATRMFKYNVYWSFSYLMVVVEDRWLGIPKSVQDQFRIKYTWQRSFAYVTEVHLLPDEKIVQFITYKAKLCLLFLKLLEIAYVQEKNRYKTAFDNLNRELGDYSCSIDMTQNRIKLRQSIIEFSEEVLQNKASVLSVDEFLNSTELKNEIDRLGEFIRDDFLTYEGNPNINSIEKKMKKYYSERV